MHTRIRSTLKHLEQEKGIRILFAAESGSRAWGFASPDSDYDIRVLYVEPLSWYLSLETSPKDSFQEMLPGDLDISAWELRKALRLFATCNPSMNEWFGSPSIYFEEEAFATEMRRLLPAYFNPIKAAFHYLSLAQHAMECLLPDATLSLKKQCYAMRGILAARWCVQKKTMPPTEFHLLLRQDGLAAEVMEALQELLLLKEKATERDAFPLSKTLCAFYEATREAILRDVKPFSFSAPSIQPLNDLFRDVL